MVSFSNELRQLARNLGLLASFVCASLALFALQSWLYAGGGWPLVVSGLVALWSAALAALFALAAQRKRRRERAIAAAVAELQRVIARHGVREDDP